MRIMLSERTGEALTRLAVRERRAARDQAVVIIETALRAEGLLRDDAPEPATEPSPPPPRPTRSQRRAQLN